MAESRLAPFDSFVELLRLARHFEFRAVSRWMALGSLVGVTAGAMAAALFLGADWVRHVAFGIGAGIQPSTPRGEPPLFGNGVGHPPVRYWMLVLAPVLGGLSCGLLLHSLCPEARGGTEGYITAFHQRQPKIRKRLPWIKLVASALFLGFGNSAGREGPIAHIGSALGAHLGALFRVSERERRFLLVAGAAAGVGAIFRTPLGGALFAVEVLYRDDFEVEALVPAVLASVVAYSLFTLVFGEGAMFAVAAEFPFDPRQLPLYLLMAVGCSIVGVLFVWAFDELERGFSKLRCWPPLKPALGGLLVGLLAVALPEALAATGLVGSVEALLGAPILGAGYGWLQEVLLPSGHFPAGWPSIAMLGCLALGKVLATCLSNSSGLGAGGIFGPSVVMGGLIGAACGTAFHQWLPMVVPQPSAFAIVGMACFVGGVTHSPISTLVMASEMTGNYQLLVPIMLAEVVTVALMQHWKHYRTQVVTRRDSPVHVTDYAMDVLKRLPVADAARFDVTIPRVAADTPVAELLRLAPEPPAVIACVCDQEEFHGLVDLLSLRGYFIDEPDSAAIVALDCAVPFVRLRPSDSLATALAALTQTQLPQLPVVANDDPNRIVGLLHIQQLLAAYSRSVQPQ